MEELDKSIPDGSFARPITINMLGTEATFQASTLREACEMFIDCFKVKALPLVIGVRYDEAGLRPFTIDYIFPELKGAVDAVLETLKR